MPTPALDNLEIVLVDFLGALSRGRPPRGLQGVWRRSRCRCTRSFCLVFGPGEPGDEGVEDGEQDESDEEASGEAVELVGDEVGGKGHQGGVGTPPVLEYGDDER